MASSVMITSRAGCLWVELPQTVTIHNHREVEQAVMPHLAGSVRKVVIDLSRTANIYSSGLGLLIRVRKSVVEKGGAVCLVNVSQKIRALLLTLNLDRVFSIFTTDTEFEVSQDDVWRGMLSESSAPCFLFVAQLENGTYRLNLSGYLSGRCDLSALVAFTPSGDIRRYVFDLSSLESLDEEGSGVLSELVVRITASGATCCAFGASENVRELYELLCADPSLRFCDSEQAAIAC